MTIQFVSAISATATVLLDLDDDAPLTVQEGASFTPPRRRFNKSSSSLRDGDNVNADSFGDREIKLPLNPSDYIHELADRGAFDLYGD